MKTFRIHWIDGKTEEMVGHSISEAFMLAGYGGGAIRAIDWWEEIK